MKSKIAFFLCIILVTALLSSGCAVDSGNSKEKNKQQFRDDQMLFAAQNRYDNDHDRGTVYGYNHKGELIISEETMTIGCYAKNGLAAALDPVSYNIGFVDENGVFIIKPIYEDAAMFSDSGIALVKIRDASTGEEKCGYINEKGEQIIPCIYDDAASFYPNGLAAVALYDEYENVVYGVINENGEVIVPIMYDKIESCSGDYIVCLKDNSTLFKNTVYDSKGNMLFDSSNETASENYYSYYLFRGTLYRGLLNIVSSNDGFTRYARESIEKYNGKEFVIIQGQSKIVYDSKQVATTRSGLGYGILYNGKLVIPYEYDRIVESGDGYYVCVKEGLDYAENASIDIYNEDFQKTAENIKYNFYPRLSEYGELAALPKGYFEIGRYDIYNDQYLYGIIDYTGAIIVEPVFCERIRICTYEGAAHFFN